ncbi:MAG: hypothetical protein GX882_04925 [Methanomicrobiales archaeon]|nr:hypothetical protein [Methanomicrobiales archaeon]
MKKYSKHDRVLMAAWAADCAERVLPLFERASPGDCRPRRAIEACREWARAGVFRMVDIRWVSLAARDVTPGSAAQFAARAAGQAVATAHVPQHAYGAAWYALKAVAAAEPADVIRERKWQVGRLPEGLREEIMRRIIVLGRGGRVTVRLQKGEGF